MIKTFVKICGITRPEDAEAAVAAGADALGFVFHPASPRAVNIDQAREITAFLGPFVTTIALFVDAEPTWVETVLAATGIHLPQFHGNETRAYCAAFGRPYIKAIRMHPNLDPQAAAHQYADAAACLFDAWDPNRAGGTGTAFDWGRLPATLPIPLVLAGGLRPDNVAAAVREVRPYAVDVSSGVESAPGHKDPALMRALIGAVRAA